MPEQSPTRTQNPLIGKAVPGDFVLLRFALVDALGGDFPAAIVFTRIMWRCETRPEGWTATREEIQAETRLSEHKVKGAIKKLVDGGYITRESAGKWDKASVWKVVGLWPDPEPEPQDSRSGENHRIDPEVPSESPGTTPEPHDPRSGENHRIDAVVSTGWNGGKSPDLPMRPDTGETPPPPPTGGDGTDTPAGQAGEGHEHEDNARQALTRLRADADLTTSVNALMVMAFEAGADGDPWDGYRKIRDAVGAGMQGTRSHTSVLRHRLGLPKIGSVA